MASWTGPFTTPPPASGAKIAIIRKLWDFKWERVDSNQNLLITAIFQNWDVGTFQRKQYIRVVQGTCQRFWKDSYTILHDTCTKRHIKNTLISWPQLHLENSSPHLLQSEWCHPVARVSVHWPLHSWLLTATRSCEGAERSEGSPPRCSDKYGQELW